MFNRKNKNAGVSAPAVRPAADAKPAPAAPPLKSGPAVFVNGIYSEAEQSMLDAFRAKAAGMSGWAGEAKEKAHFKTPLNLPAADREMFRVIARNNDAKNPLYRSEEYAGQSRWGGIIAPPMFLLNAAQTAYLPLEIPARAGRIVSCQTGADYDWQSPVYDGDRIQVFCESPRVEDETPEGKQPFRLLSACYTNRCYRQGQEYLGSITHYEKWVYAAPGTEPDGLLHIGYEKGAPLPDGAILQTANFSYTPEQAEQIQDFYEAEPRRGDHIRYWEDVSVGEILPPIVNGPITEWDAVAAIGPSAEKTLTMMEIRRRYPDKVIYDEYGIPHHKDEVFLSKSVPVSRNMYSSSAPEQTLASHLVRIVSNWMGDDGFVTALRWRRMTNAALGDTLLGRGRVVRKYRAENGDALVEIDVQAENFRGFLCAAGTVAVRLPSNGGGTCEGAAAGEASGLKAGDRVRVLPRPDWEFAGGYPLGGKSGWVVEKAADLEGYVYCVLDEGCAGLDPRAVLAFRTDALAKL